ncbi:MAG: hypothetical protein NE334_03310 [Lentisphaeraceae bacterium]|nr:hypothetical protein [Lentisphaeraceae bacterium]
MKKLLALLILVCFGLCADESSLFSEQELAMIKTMSPLPELPKDPTNEVDGNVKAILLGEAFFNDWRFSKGEEFACATCHRETDHFTTFRADTHVEIPTLYNMAHNKWYFWDGRADTLWSQSLVPLEAEIEHASSRTEIVDLVTSDEDYRPKYEALFGKVGDFSDLDRYPQPGKPSDENKEANKNWLSMSSQDQFEVNKVFANIGKIFAAYQAQIVSPKSKFDTFVEGLKSGDEKKVLALDLSAKRGLKLFVGKGQCISCHSGPNFSDNSFHDMRLPAYTKKLGLPGGRKGGISKVKNSVFSANGAFSFQKSDAHLRRLKVAAGDDFKVKTPTLRFVARTPPFMHTGQFRFLTDVVEFYSEMKGAREVAEGVRVEMTPRNFTEEEKKDLIAFLNSLSELGQ